MAILLQIAPVRPAGQLVRPAGVDSIEVVLDVVEVAIGSGTLHGLGEDGLIADEMAVSGAGFDDDGSDRGRRFCASCCHGHLLGGDGTAASSAA